MNDPSAPRGGEAGSHWGLPGLPLKDLEALVDRFGKWAGRATGGLLGDSRWTPAAEEDETADSYRIRLELPGIPRDLMSIEVEGHQVYVHGDLTSGGAGQSNFLTYRSGHFGYRTSLPADADPEAVHADLAAGILTVTVPRADRGERRTITIDEAESPTDSAEGPTDS